jgi:hypothetical protein
MSAHISISNNQTYVHNLSTALKEMLGVVRIMKSNKVAIEKACQDVFPNRQNPKEIACGENSV